MIGKFPKRFYLHNFLEVKRVRKVVAERCACDGVVDEALEDEQDEELEMEQELEQEDDEDDDEEDVEEDDEEEYDVGCIVDIALATNPLGSTSKKHRRYLVKFADCDDDMNTWEPFSSFDGTDIEDLLKPWNERFKQMKFVPTSELLELAGAKAHVTVLFGDVDALEDDGLVMWYHGQLTGIVGHDQATFEGVDGQTHVLKGGTLMRGESVMNKTKKRKKR